MKVLTLAVSVAALMFGASAAVGQSDEAAVAAEMELIKKQQEVSKGNVVAGETRAPRRRLNSGLEESNDTALASGPETGTRIEAEVDDRKRHEPVRLTSLRYPDYRLLDRSLRNYKEINFAFNSSFVDEASQQKLRVSCEAIRRSNPENTYLIYGHTDASGPEGYNKSLSQKRANAVKRFMVEECSIEPNRLTAYGMGESQLRDDMDGLADAQRRVEFLVGS